MLISMEDRHPECQAVSFNFDFRGLEAEIFTGIDLESGPSLAKIQIQLLSVVGHMNVNGALKAQAFLQNLVLEDSRRHFEDPDSSINDNPDLRITKLMEARDQSQKMIEIDYQRDEKMNQTVDIFIRSFVVVGSVSYLMEIADFFTPNESMMMQWKKDSLQNIPHNVLLEEELDAYGENEMKVFLKVYTYTLPKQRDIIQT